MSNEAPDPGWSWTWYTDRTTGTKKLTLELTDKWLKQIDRRDLLKLTTIFRDLEYLLETATTRTRLAPREKPDDPHVPLPSQEDPER